MSPVSRNMRVRLVVGGILLTLLLAAVFTMGSLDVPFEPNSWRVIIPLYAVSTFITAVLLVFSLILIRSFVRLRMEQNKNQLGARFKTKMVLGATAISLLPVIFMFFVSYSLLNRTLGRWFPRPLEIASEQTQALLNDLGRTTLPRLRSLAHEAAKKANAEPNTFLQYAASHGLDAAWLLDEQGHLLKGGVVCPNQSEDRTLDLCTIEGVAGLKVRALPSGIDIWEAAGKTYFATSIPVDLPNQPHAALVAAFVTSPDFLARWSTIQAQMQEYEHVKQSLRALKRQMLLILFCLTIVVLSALTWVALFLSKQVVVPIQALAEGTREVSAGNFDYQVPEQAQDELGILVRSFNTMTTQLRDNRAQIDEFTRNLQQAVQELERRRQLMETVLENIPAGVIYMDAAGVLQRTNSALLRMFQIPPGETLTSLERLVGPEAHATLQHLMRRASRMAVVTREIEVEVADRLLHLAVTVSSLGPRRANTGYVLVIDDLTEVLRAQKSAAWQEVARRIAHEIKNPLTPIQLSAQRILHYLDRRANEDQPPKDADLARISGESSKIIVREVATLSALVNEFSQFVRFPASKLLPTDANTMVNEAVEVFSGRLDGIQLKTALEQNLPAVRADGPLLRSVIINLIDNAAEALEDAPRREITVATHLRTESDTIEIAVADTGHGISPEDKDKLFLPYFSTKDRGTGLGLVIAARIIAEHGGSLRVEDNRPVGTRFLIELPLAEQPAPSGSEPFAADAER
ncbi:MAG TPA: ATP-binding protein [Candidatus Saccharimonadales bacterium]|nr:ATP-binding protein [Candidatus Saccharimonadales bacterium]